MKNIIITGASSGIGMATARTMDTGEYRMIIAGRNKAKLTELSDSLSCDHIIHVGDVRDYSDCQRMVQTSFDSWGGVDILVNNAGLGYFDPLESGKIEEWHNMVDINVKGVLNCLHAALPSLKERTGHVIIETLQFEFIDHRSDVYFRVLAGDQNRSEEPRIGDLDKSAVLLFHFP